jgi:predicted RecA/RadA family phage recombinase
MATNRVFERGRQFEADVSGVTGTGDSGLVLSGDPIVIGQLPGVALTSEDADGMATIQTDGVFDLPVKGETTTNAAIAVGAIVYYDAAATPHKLNADNTNGVRFGYALEAVSSGATATIRVKVGY